MPSHLARDIETLEVTGMGGGKSGAFRLSGVPGHFARGADRLGIMDPLFVRNSGGARFSLTPSTLSPDIVGRCSYREGELNSGSISITPKRFAYRCDIGSGGDSLAGRLMISDRNAPLGALHGRAEREGVLDYKGQRLVLRSIHRADGGSLPIPTPLGYMFVADGREVGAVDLNGTRKTIMAPRSGPYREAVIAGALALSVLWDPEDIHPII